MTFVSHLSDSATGVNHLATDSDDLAPPRNDLVSEWEAPQTEKEHHADVPESMFNMIAAD